jgi:HEPN domain-containing protein
MGSSPTSPVARGRATRFLERAREFALEMRDALSHGHLDVAASNAAHCVIAACDALLVSKAGRRSKARDHGKVARLIEQLGLPGAADHARQVEFVLTLKSAGQYDDRRLTTAEVEKAVKMARRVLEWVEANVARASAEKGA